ncbi:hypothetical protein B0T26DRAFT_828246, partial [Lasiosphaeria miniovina]
MASLSSQHRVGSLAVFVCLAVLQILSGSFTLAVAAPRDTPPNTNGTIDTRDVLLARDAIADSYSEGTLRGSLILFNGRISTLDAQNTVASVLAIKDAKIVYVGDSVAAALHQGSFGSNLPRQINLRGRVAVPGLIDSHNHLVLLSNRPGYHTPLENVYSIADVQAAYRQRAAAGAVPAGAFITSIGGFHFNQFRERRLPTLAELDAAAPDNPAFLMVGFSGPCATNTAGKAFLAGLPGSASVSVASNGSIAVGAESGKALQALRAQLTFADRERSARDAMAYAASVGLTTHL